MAVDTANAHVRRGTKRQEPSVAAQEARRLLDDPAFKAGVAKVRDGLVAELEGLKHDGKPETDDFEREVCRALRMLKSVVRAVSITVQGEAFRTGDVTLLRPNTEE